MRRPHQQEKDELLHQRAVFAPLPRLCSSSRTPATSPSVSIGRSKCAHASGNPQDTLAPSPGNQGQSIEPFPVDPPSTCPMVPILAEPGRRQSPLYDIIDVLVTWNFLWATDGGTYTQDAWDPDDTIVHQSNQGRRRNRIKPDFGLPGGHRREADPSPLIASPLMTVIIGPVDDWSNPASLNRWTRQVLPELNRVQAVVFGSISRSTVDFKAGGRRSPTSPIMEAMNAGNSMSAMCQLLPVSPASWQPEA